jgi:3-oxoacyl-[acyl-carrier protein] reductase
MGGYLDGHHVLVTGSARGIGFATCVRIASEGGGVWAGIRRRDESVERQFRELAEISGVLIEPIVLDVTEPVQIIECMSKIRNSGRPMTGLVNNAGLTLNAMFQMTRTEDMDAVFKTNFFGPVALMSGALRLMTRNRSGSIVNVSSSAAFDGNKGRSIYGATKAALSLVTKSVARELAPVGIRINAVAPGVTDTEMLSSMSNEVLQDIETSLDLRRRGRPEEIADVIVFLLGQGASYISGQTIRVDGGMHW